MQQRFIVSVVKAESQLWQNYNSNIFHHTLLHVHVTQGVTLALIGGLWQLTQVLMQLFGKT